MITKLITALRSTEDFFVTLEAYRRVLVQEFSTTTFQRELEAHRRIIRARETVESVSRMDTHEYGKKREVLLNGTGTAPWPRGA